VQAAGLLTNLSIFALAISALPQPFNEWLLAFALASATALAINYAGARLIVFRAPRTLGFREPSR
jgi:putative flippase GtrA